MPLYVQPSAPRSAGELRIWTAVGVVTGLAVGALIYCGMRPHPPPSLPSITANEKPAKARVPSSQQDTGPAGAAKENVTPRRKPNGSHHPKPRIETASAMSPPTLAVDSAPPSLPSAPSSAPSIPQQPQTMQAANRPRAVQETGAAPVPMSGSDSQRGSAYQDSSPARQSAGQQAAIPQPPPPRIQPTRPPPKPAYAGPLSGIATWTGKLGKNDTLTITDGTPSTGVVSGAGLPGVRVRLTVDESNLGFIETPNAANGYRRVVLRSHAKHEKITIHWNVVQ